jgi:alginate O-acetyltransferase complex protein AlgI
MLFNSAAFAVFLLVTYLAYWGTQARLQLQNVVLLVAAYVFYGWWDWRFLILLFLNCVVDWATGLWMANELRSGRRKVILAISLIANLGVLFYFKYFDFFAASAIALLKSVGMNPTWTFIHVILPVGISFYTFQSLSYTIDIYRNRISPTKDLLGFLVFHSFFPQLVAGPIERATNLLPQCLTARRFDRELATDGARQMLWGFFKKVVIADRLAPIVDQTFGSPATQSGSLLILGLIFFSVQIYCDFSGYTDIAIGVSRLFGFNLTRNFATPYFSRSVGEFWRRWHISLSTWFRDYVYISLGGNRGARWKTVRNLLITFGLSGLWHGANWTFLVWGLLNGAYLVAGFLAGRQAPADASAGGRIVPSLTEVLRILLTFWLITFAWTFFRASSVEAAMAYLSAIGTRPFRVSALSIYVPTAGLCAAMFGVEWFQRERLHGLSIAHLPCAVRRGVYYVLVGMLLLFGSVESTPFIYFQF